MTDSGIKDNGVSSRLDRHNRPKSSSVISSGGLSPRKLLSRVFNMRSFLTFAALYVTLGSIIEGIEDENTTEDPSLPGYVAHSIAAFGGNIWNGDDVLGIVDVPGLGDGVAFVRHVFGDLADIAGIPDDEKGIVNRIDTFKFAAGAKSYEIRKIGADEYILLKNEDGADIMVKKNSDRGRGILNLLEGNVQNKTNQTSEQPGSAPSPSVGPSS